jgi:hypothetical protein
MSQAAPDDLDALLASLLAPAPASEPEPVAEPAPVAATLLPELPAEAAAIQAGLRAWLHKAAPGDIFNPSALDPPTPEAESLEPEILLELAAARAWRAGDQEAFDRALARLSAGSAQHHRRMAAVVDMIRTKQQARAAFAPTPEGRS